MGSTSSFDAISRLQIYYSHGSEDSINLLQDFCLVAPAYGSLTHLRVGQSELGSVDIEQPRLLSLRELRALDSLEMLVFELSQGFLESCPEERAA
jgi:hypothetical protein